MTKQPMNGTGQRLSVTLLGHKDHGKSTLIGRFLFDTKSVIDDRIHEVSEISKRLGLPYQYCFLLDSFQEEREGGMTMDVIHAQIKGKRYSYDCIDVPGHKELIKNMLTGASHADVGILIISVKEGIEEQTGQHIRLAQWLGLSHFIVAVNKMDTVNYDQGVFEGMKENLLRLIGEKIWGQISFVPVSAYNGENVVTRSPNMAWYTGPTLYEAMETLDVRKDLSEMPLRFPVQDCYKDANDQWVTVGRIESGFVTVGQPVVFFPSGTKTTVKEIMKFNETVTMAGTGENIGLVCDPNPAMVKRGEVCCAPETAAGVYKEIMAHAVFIEPMPEQIVVECGMAQGVCEWTPLSPMDIGEVTPITLRLQEPMVMEHARTTLGRIALKHHGKIMGVAVVMQ